MLENLPLDLAGGLISGLLTVMILSYLIGDNPLFRVATHIFIGVAAGYAGAVIWHSILKPSLIDPLLSEGPLVFLQVEYVGLIVLTLLLLTKISPSSSQNGTLPMALLVGIGAAIVIGGAITGTLLPQAGAVMENLNPAAGSGPGGESGIERAINAGIILVGSIATFLYFRFSARQSENGQVLRTPLGEFIARLGRAFIAITFGALYAGALLGSLVVLTERVNFLLDLLLDLIAGWPV